MAFDRAMQRALDEDGQKLRELTGEDHGPAFLLDPDPCPLCGQEWWYCGETLCPQPMGGSK